MKQSIIGRIFKRALITSAAVAAANLALAAPVDKNHALGTIHSPFASVGPRVIKIDSRKAQAFQSYTQSEYTTGGVALRNRGAGMIHINGLTHGAKVEDAYLYWSELFSGAAAAHQNISLSRMTIEGAAAANVKLNGKLIGTAGDPCWGSSGTAIYRTQVPKTLATGNGLYFVSFAKKASGLTTGEDPWDGNIKFPLAEGASLVVVAQGSSSVKIFDFFEQEFQGGQISYSLPLGKTGTIGNQVLFDSIGADGQIGNSRSVFTSFNTTQDTVTINGIQISGPGSFDDSDADWNGSAGWPLPQLWDDTGHDISDAAPAGTKVLNVSINTPADCLVTVANVVSY